MALPSTIHRFQLAVSDVDRGVYETLEVQIARHPSETLTYAVTRVLAYCLEWREGLAFGRGLSSVEEPTLSAPGPHGTIGLWIDVGGPSADRLHKASKQAEEVCVYTYKDVERLLEDWRSQRIHKAEAIRVVAIPAAELEPLCERVGRNNSWDVLRTEGRVYVTVGGETLELDATTTALGEPSGAA